MSAPAIAHPLPDPLVELIAGRFKALGDPTRIRLVDRLHAGEATVTELAAAARTSEQNASKQLLLLLRAGVVARRREGNFVYYRIADEAVFELCATVCGRLREEIAALAESVSAGPDPAGRAPAH